MGRGLTHGGPGAEGRAAVQGGGGRRSRDRGHPLTHQTDGRERPRCVLCRRGSSRRTACATARCTHVSVRHGTFTQRPKGQRGSWLSFSFSALSRCKAFRRFRRLPAAVTAAGGAGSMADYEAVEGPSDLGHAVAHENTTETSESKDRSMRAWPVSPTRAARPGWPVATGLLALHFWSSVWLNAFPFCLARVPSRTAPPWRGSRASAR